MATARIYHTAIPLNSGKVLVTGGIGSGGDLVSAELYDPSSGTFSSTGGMATGRYLHTATRLHIGKVLVTGGTGSSGYLASAEVYNPSTGIFSPAASMATRRDGQTATLMDGGKILVIGGVGSSGYLASPEPLRSFDWYLQPDRQHDHKLQRSSGQGVYPQSIVYDWPSECVE